MTAPTEGRQRLLNQQIARQRFATPADLVRWMGAVQAQDYLGSLWAIGLRLPGARESEVEEAIAERTIVRTWPMRGTLHFVPAADVRWMLRLLTPRVIARSAGRYRELGLDDTAFARSRRILERALRGGRPLTRPETYAAIERGGVSTEGQRGIHIVGHLAQQGLVCFGPRRGRQPTFVLLDQWVPAARELPRDEALGHLARRYFTSHGPATVHDFAWWSGLLLKEAQAATLAAASDLIQETRDGRTWWWSAASPKAAPTTWGRPVAALLPPWDEAIVAYKDRLSALGHLPAGDKRVQFAVGNSLIIIDGRVCGSWRRTVTAGSVRVELDFWTRVREAERRAAHAAARRYGGFLGKTVEISRAAPYTGVPAR